MAEVLFSFDVCVCVCVCVCARAAALNISKTVKATDFKFDVHVLRNSLNMISYTFSKRGRGQGHMTPKFKLNYYSAKIHLAEICTLTSAFEFLFFYCCTAVVLECMNYGDIPHFRVVISSAQTYSSVRTMQRWKWISRSWVKWVTIFGWVTWVMGHSQ